MLVVMAVMSCSILIGTASASDASTATEEGDIVDQTCANDGTCINDGDIDDDDFVDDDDDDDGDDDDDDNDSQSDIDEETGEAESFDRTKQFKVEIVNLSDFRADVYWDDGKYGVSMFTVDANGGTSPINTFIGHGFFVTRHGVRENLYPKEVDGEEDKPLKFVVKKPNQKLVIPEGAAPLNGERAAKNRCVDRYGMCVDEGKVDTFYPEHKNRTPDNIIL
jgi:hypothetical protein